jgi:hypothetical protein
MAAVGLRSSGQDFSLMHDEFAARRGNGTVAFYDAYVGTEPVSAGRLEVQRAGEPPSANHVVSWTPLVGASLREVYYSVDHCLTYSYSLASNSTQSPTQNTADVRVAVKACNGAGCSWLSNDCTTGSNHDECAPKEPL